MAARKKARRKASKKRAKKKASRRGAKKATKRKASKKRAKKKASKKRSKKRASKKRSKKEGQQEAFEEEGFSQEGRQEALEETRQEEAYQASLTLTARHVRASSNRLLRRRTGETGSRDPASLLFLGRCAAILAPRSLIGRSRWRARQWGGWIGTQVPGRRRLPGCAPRYPARFLPRDGHFPEFERVRSRSMTPNRGSRGAKGRVPAPSRQYPYARGRSLQRSIRAPR